MSGQPLFQQYVQMILPEIDTQQTECMLCLATSIMWCSVEPSLELPMIDQMSCAILPMMYALTSRPQQLQACLSHARHWYWFELKSGLEHAHRKLCCPMVMQEMIDISCFCSSDIVCMPPCWVPVTWDQIKWERTQHNENNYHLHKHQLVCMQETGCITILALVSRMTGQSEQAIFVWGQADASQQHPIRPQNWPYSDITAHKYNSTLV